MAPTLEFIQILPVKKSWTRVKGSDEGNLRFQDYEQAVWTTSRIHVQSELFSNLSLELGLNMKVKKKVVSSSLQMARDTKSTQTFGALLLI